MARKKFFKVDLAPAIKRLEIISKGLVNTKVIGNYLSVFRGKGIEFEEYAPYSPEYDANTIDWKATARTGDLLVREYVEERDINVFFVVDASSNMLFGSKDKLKIEYAIELIAGLTYAALEAGDRVGFILTSNKVVKSILPDRGRKQFYIISKTLLNVDYYGGNFNLKAAVDYIINRIEETTVVIIVSDFANFKPEDEEILKLISKKFNTIGIMVRDIRDKELPQEALQIVVSDPEGKKNIIIESGLIKEAYEHAVMEHEKMVREKFLKTGCDFIAIETDKSYVQPITSLFRARALRWK